MTQTIREEVYTQDEKGNRKLVETREYEAPDEIAPDPQKTVEEDLAALKDHYAALSAKVEALETKNDAGAIAKG